MISRTSRKASLSAAFVVAALAIACSRSKSTHSAATPTPSVSAQQTSSTGGNKSQVVSSQSNGSDAEIDPTTGQAFSANDACYVGTYRPCLDEHKAELDTAFSKYKLALAQLKEAESGTESAKLATAQKEYIDKDAGYRQIVSDTGCYVKYDACKVKADSNYRGEVLGKDWTPAPSASSSSSPAPSVDPAGNSGTSGQ